MDFGTARVQGILWHGAWPGFSAHASSDEPEAVESGLVSAAAGRATQRIKERSGIALMASRGLGGDRLGQPVVRFLMAIHNSRTGRSLGAGFSRAVASGCAEPPRKSVNRPFQVPATLWHGHTAPNPAKVATASLPDPGFSAKVPKLQP
jgi:hypothetical protein